LRKTGHFYFALTGALTGVLTGALTGVSNLFRNVPFLTSLEMSLFF
jgi:hypothetical protein